MAVQASGLFLFKARGVREERTSRGIIVRVLVRIFNNHCPLKSRQIGILSLFTQIRKIVYTQEVISKTEENGLA